MGPYQPEHHSPYRGIRKNSENGEENLFEEPRTKTPLIWGRKETSAFRRSAKDEPKEIHSKTHYN